MATRHTSMTASQTRSKVKTRLYSGADLAGVNEWAERRLELRHRLVRWPIDEQLPSYFRNFDGDEMAGQRGVILAALADLDSIYSARGRALARCAVLRTAQWALDMRREIPSAEHLAEGLASTAAQMAKAAGEATTKYRAADKCFDARGCPRSLIVQQGVPGLARHKAVAASTAPRLVLTSPPYPGVYVNYHRWKLRGRLETPLPYFIAGQQDGHGLSHYTMSARVNRSLDTYFDRLEAAFVDVAQMCDRSTAVIQIVGFNDVAAQLPRYLSAEQVRYHYLSRQLVLTWVRQQRGRPPYVLTELARRLQVA